MSWKKVNAAGGQKIVSFSKTLTATAVANDRFIGEWPFIQRGRILAITQGAQSIASAPVIQWKKFTAVGSSTANLVAATKAVPAGEQRIIDADDADTVEALEVFAQGDRVLGDLTGGNVTEMVVTVYFAIG